MARRLLWPLLLMCRDFAPPLLLLALLSFACGDQAGGARDPNAPDGGLGACAFDDDCPSGLLCREAACVSPEDLLPPDFETDQSAPRPLGTEAYLFALSPDTGSVLVIDPADLSIRSLRVPAEPIAMALRPSGDALVVLSREGRALSIVSLENDELRLEVARLPRRYARVSVSPDGRYAVLYTPDGQPADEGAEGLVAFVDLDGLLAGEDVTAVEYAAGYRHTNVFYRVDRGLATLAIVLGKDEVTIVELSRVSESGDYLPTRRRLPETLSEVIGREAVAIESSPYVLLRSFAHPGIAVLDVDSAELFSIDLPALATDLDLSPNGDVAVAALRATNQVAVLPLPDVLTATNAIRFLDVPQVRPGQVVFGSDSSQVAVFSTQDELERFGLLDLVSGEVQLYDRLKKRIRQISVSQDGRSAIVLHSAQPTSSVADDYERAVDQDEGYSVVDLESGAVQLKRTGRVAPTELVFSSSSRFAAVTLRDPDGLRHRVEAVNLDTLIAKTFALGSAPEFSGSFSGNDERIWITQEHAAGRISILDLESNQLRTLTGYELNAEIE